MPDNVTAKHIQIGIRNLSKWSVAMKYGIDHFFAKNGRFMIGAWLNFDFYRIWNVLPYPFVFIAWYHVICNMHSLSHVGVIFRTYKFLLESYKFVVAFVLFVSKRKKRTLFAHHTVTYQNCGVCYMYFDNLFRWNV